MGFNAPRFDSFDFVYDNDEVTFDGLPASGIEHPGRPPVIPDWIPAYATTKAKK